MAKKSGKQRRGVRSDTAEQRRIEVASLRRQGRTMKQIAEELKVTPLTIFNDVKLLREEWRARIAQDYDAHMAEQFDRLNSVFETAWKRYQKTIDADHPGGNPALLEICRKSAIDIGKMIGLADPVEFQGKRVREGDDATGGGQVDIVEVVVSSREELTDITTPEGTISLAMYKRRIEESVRLKNSGAG